MKKAKEYLEGKDINPKEPIFWYSGVDYMTIEQVITDYAKLYASEKVKEALNLAAERSEVKKVIAYPLIPRINKSIQKSFINSCSGVVESISVDPDSILSLETELLNQIQNEI